MEATGLAKTQGKATKPVPMLGINMNNMDSKIIFLAFLLALIGCSEVPKEEKTDNIFVVRHLGSGFTIDFKKEMDTTYYATPYSMYFFFLHSKALPENQKVHAIKELLTFEGDTRKCFHHIASYNKNQSQFYLGETQNVTLEVWALFLINKYILITLFIMRHIQS